MRLKISVHTKSGKKLVYYSDWESNEKALNWWMSGLSGSGSVKFGPYTMVKENIDFVEIR